MWKIITVYCFISLLVLSAAAQQQFIKVHFLYGSKPRRVWKDTEPKWFGGVLGGHVGVEADSNQILNFVPGEKHHLFGRKKKFRSLYLFHSYRGFYSILGGNPDSAKKTIIYIPVTPPQRQRFDSLAAAYTRQSPYDYAVLGMRCGAAGYDILAQLGILNAHGRTWTSTAIFYPKKLRKRLLRKAIENNWLTERSAGSVRRRWERD